MALSYKSISINFVETTGFPGIARIKNGLFIAIRLFWVLAMAGGFALLYVHASSLVGKFIAHPTQVSMAVKLNDSLLFPAVTLCNLNPIPKSSIECSERYKQLAQMDHFANLQSYNAYVGNVKSGELSQNFKMRSLAVIDDYPCTDMVNQFRNELAYGGMADMVREGLIPEKNIGDAVNIRLRRETETTTNPEPQTDDGTLVSNGINDDTTGPPDYDASELNDILKNASALLKQQFNDFQSYVDKLGAYQAMMSVSLSVDLSDVRDFIFVDRDKIKEVATKPKDFIIECSFDRQPCTVKSFRTVYTKRYGMCQSFNFFNVTRDRAVRTENWGSTYGLSVTMDIKAKEYIGLLAPAYGVRVAIHDPQTPPVPEVDGFNAGPGQLTEIALQYGEMHRLKHPFESNCTDSFEEDYKKFLSPTASYSVGMCKILCREKALTTECSCGMDIFDFKIRQCDIFNETDRDCMFKAAGLYNQTNCQCPSPCFEMFFNPRISTAKYPTKQYEKMAINNMMGIKEMSIADLLIDNEASDSYDKRTYAFNNFVKLNIYYSSQTYQSVIEAEAYGFVQLIADLGGILGLYMGLSVMHLMEFFELLLMFCIHCCSKKNQPKPVVND